VINYFQTYLQNYNDDRLQMNTLRNATAAGRITAKLHTKQNKCTYNKI